MMTYTPERTAKLPVTSAQSRSWRLSSPASCVLLHIVRPIWRIILLKGWRATSWCHLWRTWMKGPVSSMDAPWSCTTGSSTYAFVFAVWKKGQRRSSLPKTNGRKRRWINICKYLIFDQISIYLKLLLTWFITPSMLCLLQVKLDNAKTELETKIQKREKQLDEVKRSLQDCKVSWQSSPSQSEQVIKTGRTTLAFANTMSIE